MTLRKGIWLYSILCSVVIFIAVLGKSVWTTILFPYYVTYFNQGMGVLSTLLVGILLGLIWWRHRERQDLVYQVLIIFMLTRAMSWMPAVTQLHVGLINYICSIFMIVKLYQTRFYAENDNKQVVQPITSRAFRYGCLIIALYAYYVIYRFMAIGTYSNRYGIEGLFLFVGIAALGHVAYRKHPNAPVIRKLGLGVTLVGILFAGSGGLIVLKLVSSHLLSFIHVIHLLTSGVVFALLWLLSWRTRS
ncbi:hypothetical protein D3C77_343800 [compost metagenome]